MFYKYLISLCGILFGGFGFLSAQDWLKQIGGEGADEGQILTSNANSVYLAGSFQQSLKLGDYALKSAGQNDVFIAQYNDSYQLKSLRHWASKGSNRLVDMATDSVGNLYAVASFSDSLCLSTDHWIYSMGEALFVVKYAPSGQLLWSIILGGTNLLLAEDLAVDKDQNIYLTGYFQDSLMLGELTLQTAAFSDFFLLKINKNGTLDWVRQSDRAMKAKGKTVALAKDAVYVAGEFVGEMLLGSDSSKANPVYSYLFLAKYAKNGQLKWLRFFDGVYNNHCRKLVIDTEENLYLGGDFVGQLNIVPTRAVTAFRYYDLFLAKLDSSGRGLWIRQSQGNGNTHLTDLIFYKNQLLFCGYFKTAMSLDSNFYQTEKDTDLYWGSYDRDGKLLAAKVLGGTGNELAKSIVIGFSNQILISGSFQSKLTLGRKKWTAKGNSDAFWASFALPDIPLPAFQFIEVELKLKGEMVELRLNNPLGLRWQLYNLDSQLVKRGEVQKIDLSDLANGIYSLSIQTVEGVAIRKLIKK